MSDALDKLDSFKRDIGGQGDYAPWWTNDNFSIEEGDELVGVCVEKHKYNDPGGDDHPVATVRSIGGDRSHLDSGVEVSTPTRKGIEPFAGDLEIGDLALIEYSEEVSTNTGRDMRTYSASRMSEETWRDMDIAETVDEVWKASGHWNGGSGNEDSSSSRDEEVPSDVVDFAEDSVKIGGDDGELPLDDLDTYLNETRDFEVSPADVVRASSRLEADGDTVKLT
jgi:hypothetical protein